MDRSANLIIAIDGHSACGKSTLAKDLAKVLGFTHIDSGAMYRAVAYLMIRHGIGVEDDQSIEQLLLDINIDFEVKDGEQHLILNDSDITKEIRTPEVNNIVSEVAAISSVRRALVNLQRKMSAGKSVVMDGRDIGTVVFPNADIKLFLTASQDVRVFRRLLELKEKGIEIPKEKVRENLIKRDHIDSTREDSPLRKAEDAILVDNSKMSREDQLNYTLDIIKKHTDLTID